MFCTFKKTVQHFEKNVCCLFPILKRKDRYQLHLGSVHFCDNSLKPRMCGIVGSIGINQCVRTVFVLKRESGSSRVVSMTWLCCCTDGISVVNECKQPDKTNQKFETEYLVCIKYHCLDCVHTFFSFFFICREMVWKPEQVMLLHRSYQPKPAGWWPRFSLGPAELSGLWPSDAQLAAWLWMLWKPPRQVHQLMTSLLHLHLLVPLPLRPPHHLWFCLLDHLLTKVAKGQKESYSC